MTAMAVRARDATSDAARFLAARNKPVRLVIFDCDGVLIDSEPVANRVVGEMLAELGWSMDAGELDARLRGLSVRQIVPLAEAETGQPVPPAWTARLRALLVATLGREAPLIPGAREALSAATALGLPWRVASNSSHEEMAAKFGRNGLAPLMAGRCHSHRDVPLGKPAPDVFLAAAAAEDVPPAECLVVEDSVPGVRGARAAGMDVLGLAGSGQGEALAAAGAILFGSMAELPRLLAIAAWVGR